MEQNHSSVTTAHWLEMRLVKFLSIEHFPSENESSAEKRDPKSTMVHQILFAKLLELNQKWIY